eukprot:UN11051
MQFQKDSSAFFQLKKLKSEHSSEMVFFNFDLLHQQFYHLSNVLVFVLFLWDFVRQYFWFPKTKHTLLFFLSDSDNISFLHSSKSYFV